MADTEYLDRFEKNLEEGLVKLCTQAKLLGGTMLTSPDMTEKWENEYLKEFMGDAVNEFNDSPDVAMAWAGYLGMGVAHGWDADWDFCKNVPYKEYYGNRGWDNMDDHIMDEILQLNELERVHVTQGFQSCAQAILVLLRRENIDTQTETGFYALVRICSVMFSIGNSMELYRLGYSQMAISQ